MAMASAKCLAPLLPSPPSEALLSPPSSSLTFSSFLIPCCPSSIPSSPSRWSCSHSLPLRPSSPQPSLRFSPPSHSTHLLCRAAEYKFPDPIPEFAESETNKFQAHMLKRLTEKKQYFGEYVEEIVSICTEILRNFLHTEYGGPGTLLVIPFIDMADTIRERELPGAPQAARAAVVWAQKHVDKDWKEWTGDSDSD